MGNCTSLQRDVVSADGGADDAAPHLKAGRTVLAWCHRLSDSVRLSIVYRSAFPFMEPTDAAPINTPPAGSQIDPHPSSAASAGAGATHITASAHSHANGSTRPQKAPASKRVAIAAEATPTTEQLVIRNVPKDDTELALIGEVTSPLSSLVCASPHLVCQGCHALGTPRGLLM